MTEGRHTMEKQDMTPTNTLAAKLELLAELKGRKRELDELTKENNALIKQTEQETVTCLLDMADSSGIDDPMAFTVTLNGRRYGVTMKHYYSIKSENRDAAHAALRELGLGDLIVEKVDHRTLTKTLEQIIEDNGGELPEGYTAIPLTEYDETKISDRKVGR